VRQTGLARHFISETIEDWCKRTSRNCGCVHPTFGADGWPDLCIKLLLNKEIRTLTSAEFGYNSFRFSQELRAAERVAG
jgi:hypothetical protein